MPPGLAAQVEICDNAIDDDGDGRTDLNDEDCACEIIEPVSLIPNPSFEEMNCCPNDRSQLNCASNWIQASAPTTDFLHQCNWMGWDEFPPPQPFPDGEGIMGFRDGRVIREGQPEPYWKEYAGACLTSPLLANSTYRFQFDVGFVDPSQSPPINITFYGTSSCEYLPFGEFNEAFGCPTNSPDWKKLGEVRVSGGWGSSWVNTFIQITPTENIHAIAIGPGCAPVPSSVSTYYFFDNLLLADQELFDLKISETTHPCDPDFTLSVPNNVAFDYQWYLGGVALVGEVTAELSRNYGVGAYQVRIIDSTTCRITETYDYVIPTYRTPARVAICEDDVYPFGAAQLREPGIYVDTFSNRNGCDSIVTLELEVVGATYDTVAASVLRGELFEIGDYGFRAGGDYPLVFTSSLGCDSLVLLQLSSFDVFFPTAFSPNGDNTNDVFRPFAPVGTVEAVDMRIYDRWGSLVYQGPEWDGTTVQLGVFVYLINIQFTNGTAKLFSGGVTVVR